MQINDPHLSHVVIIGFVRYSLSRSSYFVSDCGNLLRETWHAIPANTRKIVATDIAEALYHDDTSIETIKNLVAQGMVLEDCECYRYLESHDRRSWELILEFIVSYEKHHAEAIDSRSKLNHNQ